MKLHKLLFYIVLFLIPVQTRVLFNPDSAYVSWYFDYHLAIFLYLTDILLIACFTSWLVFDPPKKADLVKNKLFWLFLGFIAIALISLFHVKHQGLGIYQILKWIEFLLIPLYIYFTFGTNKDFDWALGLIFGSAILQAGIGWAQFHVQHMLGLRFLGEYIAPLGTSGLATIDTSAGKIIRAYGTMSHPNILGAFLVLGLICGLYFVSRATGDEVQDKKIRLASLIGLLVIMAGLFTTFSRLSWVAAGFAMIIFAIYFLWNNKKNLVLILLIPIILSAATALTLYSDDLKARVVESNDKSVTDRYFFDKLGLELIKKNPLIGVGVGDYVYALEDNYKLEPWQHQPAHNIFIFIAAELGLIGAGIFIALIYEILKRFQKSEWNNLTFTLATLGVLFLLLSQFDHYFVTIQQGRLMFAVTLGLIAALPHIYDHQKIS